MRILKSIARIMGLVGVNHLIPCSLFSWKIQVHVTSWTHGSSCQSLGCHVTFDVSRHSFVNGPLDIASLADVCSFPSQWIASVFLFQFFLSPLDNWQCTVFVITPYSLFNYFSFFVPWILVHPQSQIYIKAEALEVCPIQNNSLHFKGAPLKVRYEENQNLYIYFDWKMFKLLFIMATPRVDENQNSFLL